ncbi:MAG: serine/threonine protein kinase [Deltaproteobacteria bacterium]|nr:serine/threonine protein kinase [Deltaproteobacteria bacterium]
MSPSLSPQVVLAGVKRLRVIAAAAIFLRLHFLGLALARRFVGDAAMKQAGFPAPAHEHALLLGAEIGVGLALAMMALTFVRAISPPRLLSLGAGFIVIQALLLALPDYSFPWAHPHLPRGVPQVLLWCLVVPLMPMRPSRALMLAFAAAAMGPVAAWLASTIGWAMPPMAVALLYWWPIVSAAPFVALVAWLIHRVSARVARSVQLGSYELVQPIAAGGMGQVWLARHASLSRPAAVKVVQPRLLSRLSQRELEAMLTDFEREAQRTASLRSPHTVQLYDFGRTHDGTLFYAMELLGGLNLEQLVDRFGPQPAGRVVALLQQACRALAEAHATGIIHRDIKSANLQVGIVGGEFDFVKVLDFGLSVTAAVGQGEQRERFVKGTPAYLPPEAARVGGVVDARSDLYALGCVAYELLTGKLPFEMSNETEMLRAHVELEPEALSSRTAIAIPPELEQLVMQLLEKRPELRPQTAAEVEARLRRIARTAPWTQSDALAWWRAQVPDELDRATESLHARAPTLLDSAVRTRPGRRSGRLTVPARSLRPC